MYVSAIVNIRWRTEVFTVVRLSITIKQQKPIQIGFV